MDRLSTWRGCVSGRLEETPNTKHQKNTKLQTPSQPFANALELGVWCLVFPKSVVGVSYFCIFLRSKPCGLSYAGATAANESSPRQYPFDASAFPLHSRRRTC